MIRPYSSVRKGIASSGLALAIACAWVPAASAQEAPENSEISAELAEMRAQMAAMAERIAELESDLAATDTAVEAVAGDVATLPVAAAPAPKSETEITWKGAPEIKGEGGWSFKPRGRLNIDAGFINAPDTTGRPEGYGSTIRRARLGVQGDMPGGFGYKFEFDVAGNELDITDALISYETGDLTVSVGQRNQFQNLDELTSSLHSSFIERSAITDAFGFERKLGVSLEYKTGDVLLQTALYNDNFDDLSNKNWGTAGRVVYMPKLGDNQLHFGASVDFSNLEAGSSVRYRQRPLVAFTDERFINTGQISADSERALGLEAAGIFGQFHVAGETYWQSVNRPTGFDDADFFGAYAEVGYFLTKGDSRGYRGGAFNRVRPANPVGEGGLGAWQVNFRYDHLDLNDGPIIGGIQNAYHASLIWTPTDHTRLLLNYGKQDYTDAIFPTGTGDTSYTVDVFGVRAQVDF